MQSPKPIHRAGGISPTQMSVFSRKTWGACLQFQVLGRSRHRAPGSHRKWSAFACFSKDNHQICSEKKKKRPLTFETFLAEHLRKPAISLGFSFCQVNSWCLQRKQVLGPWHKEGRKKGGEKRGVGGRVINGSNSCPHELTAILVIYIRLAQDQALSKLGPVNIPP